MKAPLEENHNFERECLKYWYRGSKSYVLGKWICLFPVRCFMRYCMFVRFLDATVHCYTDGLIDELETLFGLFYIYISAAVPWRHEVECPNALDFPIVLRLFAWLSNRPSIVRLTVQLSFDCSIDCPRVPLSPCPIAGLFLGALQPLDHLAIGSDGS